MDVFLVFVFLRVSANWRLELEAKVEPQHRGAVAPKCTCGL